MAKAQEIISLMGEIAPVRLAEEWDNVGLQIGDINNEVGKILLALDLNNKVIDEAIENNCNMIIWISYIRIRVYFSSVICFNNLKKNFED